MSEGDVSVLQKVLCHDHYHHSCRCSPTAKHPAQNKFFSVPALARSRVLSLSSEGFQEMVGIVVGRTTHGSNGLITSAYCI